MRKLALLFLLAVFVPSCVLAWLAVRSLRDQQFVLERQQALLHQGVTDSIAAHVETLVVQWQHEFAAQVERLLARDSADDLAGAFDETLRRTWPAAKVGFVVTAEGDILEPSPGDRPEARLFRMQNSLFLANQEPAEVYVDPAQTELAGVARKQDPFRMADADTMAMDAARAETGSMPEPGPRAPFSPKAPQVRMVVPQTQSESLKTREQRPMESAQAAVSKLIPAEAEFRQLVQESSQGFVARFVDNKLNLLFWYRSPRHPRHIFGAQMELTWLVEQLAEAVKRLELQVRDQLCVAILDDHAKPMALSHADFHADWKRPFVATEIGEMLPHWEVAGYLLNPHQLTRAAQITKLTLGLLIALLVLAIGVGGWLIVTDLNRQLTLARQKTDFVSNVSHELKTPLTSIRMFSELLAEGRVKDPDKQRSYLNIITAEAGRLTRLINNVLDFSRMERGEKRYNMRECDLTQVIRDTVESYRPQLENNGFALRCESPASVVPVRGDCDALAQVIVNLLSNAEKYSDHDKEVVVEVAVRQDSPPCAEVRVLDKGPGVPRGSEQKVFEKFYRAHDLLSSGIQGSGLGLTLARQIARAHGGDVVYAPREGGGSCFCLRLPLLRMEEPA